MGGGGGRGIYSDSFSGGGGAGALPGSSPRPASLRLASRRRRLAPPLPGLASKLPRRPTLACMVFATGALLANAHFSIAHFFSPWLA